MLDTILGYDATGGGVAAVVPPTSLTTKGAGTIVGYFYDGISAEEVTITCPTDEDWPAAGFSLPATSDGTAVGAGLQWMPLDVQVPVKANKALVLTTTSGGNPVHVGVYVDYPGLGGASAPFSIRQPGSAKGIPWTRSTVAGGTNCAAGTIVQGATNLTNFGNHTWTPVAINANAAFTTTAFLGIRKLGGANLLPIFPVGLTDVANDMRGYGLPHGIGQTYTGNDAMEIFWSSVTGEQPTANITFARAGGR
jgi:hypothetical protein